MVDAIGAVQFQSTSSRFAPQSEVASVSVSASQPVNTQDFVTSSIHMDNLQNVAILEYVAESGKVIQQYPTQNQIEAFKNAERLQNARESGEHTTTVSIHSAPHVEAAKTPAPQAPAPSSGSSADTHSVIA